MWGSLRGPCAVEKQRDDAYSEDTRGGVSEEKNKACSMSKSVGSKRTKFFCGRRGVQKFAARKEHLALSGVAQWVGRRAAS